MSEKPITINSQAPTKGDPRPYYPSEFDVKSQLAEVRRELGFRRVVYPRMVVKGTKTQEDAKRQIAAMEAVAITLTEVLRREDELREPKLPL